jgi:hypothetical protein
MNLGDGGGGDSLYTVNTSTGAATLVGANGVSGNGIDGIAFLPAAVPEIDGGLLAGAMVVLSGGVLMLRGRLRRKVIA